MSGPANPRLHRFRTRFYPAASDAQWDDWRWQLRNRLKSGADVARILVLSPDEQAALQARGDGLPLGITPYYAHLLDEHDPAQGLRRTHLPATAEHHLGPSEAHDPLGEDHHTVTPGLVHRYPDRVLFLVTGTCATYCRYCTRARMVGQPGGEYGFRAEHWDGAIAYIAAHPEIRDVLLSGGDALTLADDKLDTLLGRLRAIPHVQFLRLGSKIPATLPQRVTPELAAILRKHRAWLSIHATHPDELTPEMAVACDRLADAGIPLGSQTVLLRGVNDDPDTMTRLMHGLLAFRVRPYYLYQCDPIAGSAHFRTSVQAGLDLIAALRGHTTGYAVPHFVVDAPGGGGKVALLPDSRAGRDGDDILLRNYAGATFRYPDPVALA